MKKKAMNVVVVILIILLSVSAVTILYPVIKKLVQQPIMSPASCFNYKLSIQTACYNDATNEIEITLQKIDNLEIQSIYFILNLEQESSAYCCDEKCPQCEVLDSGSKKYFLSSEKKYNSVTLKADDCIIETKEIVDC